MHCLDITQYFLLKARYIMAEDDPAEALRSLFCDLQVPELLQTALFDTGIASIGDFAFAYVTIADLSSFSQQNPSLPDMHCKSTIQNIAQLRRVSAEELNVTRLLRSIQTA